MKYYNVRGKRKPINVNIMNLNVKLVRISEPFWDNDRKAYYPLYETTISKRLYEAKFLFLLNLGGYFLRPQDDIST